MVFSEADIPDLTGKIAITVAVLAAKGAKDVHISYPSTKAAQIEFLEVDLTSAVSAKANLLYNNAGVMGTPQEKLSRDGYEFQSAVNVFGTFVFTYHLIPILLFTAEMSPPGSVRIVNTSSDGAKQAPKSGIPLDDKTLGSPASRFQSYGQSKIGVILLTRQLAKRYPTIMSLAPHPGPVQSNLTRELGIPRPVIWILNRVVYKPVRYGTLTQLFAGTTPALGEEFNGSYLVPLAKFETRLPHPQCYDDDFGSNVWEWNMAAMEAASGA
ncbi:NAD(P)-binding protein [Xylaria arbuscula]|nr:NAD(P)-binding protein [Xylaria arbuscula]